jgi:UDP:flavonoid glycosyltransferase YjiC (YdhE family)
LYGFSAHVVPRPHDWPAQHHITGFWFADPSTSWQPPLDLQRFLHAGSPPIAIGWSSMTDEGVRRLVPHVLAALQHHQQRAVLLGAGSAHADLLLPPSMFAIDAVPHGWLFPQVAAVVHHGGAGTTAAILRAGLPTVVTPFAVDQFFWGERVHALGTGPAPVPARLLTAERLAAILNRAVNDPTIRRGASELGEQIRSEHGVANAVSLLQRIAG